MTLHKAPNKRRIKNFLRIVGKMTVLFAITLAILCGIVYSFRSTKVLSPLAADIHRVLQGNFSGSSDLKALLQQQHLSVNSLAINSDGSFLVILTDGEEIIFSKNKNLQEQIASLQLIRNRLTIEGKMAHRVDFRFDNPVVTF